MTYSAGDAQARFLLDITPLEQNARRALAIIEETRRRAQQPILAGGAGGSAKDLQAQAALARSQAALLRAQTAQVRATQAQTRADADAAATASRRARDEANLARDLAKRTKAEQDAATATARAAKETENAAAAASRRRQAEAREAQGAGRGTALPRTFAGFENAGSALQLAGSVAGGLGIAASVPALLGGAVDAGRRSLELEQTIALTRELAGSQETYNQVISAAREQQELYGGSLQENIQGLSGLIITSRSSGAELQQLIDLSQRLSLLDPSQGTEGARIALSEALSGDPRSLALRYEIPKTALSELTDASKTAEERLLVLDQYLNKIGITAGLSGEVVSEQTKTFNALGAEIDALTTRGGAGLADLFAPAAEGLGRLIGLINQNPQALAELRALREGRGGITGDDVARAQTDINAGLARQSLGGPFTGAAEAGLEGSGVGLEEAAARTAALIGVSSEAQEAILRLNNELALGQTVGAAYAEELGRLEAQFGLVGTAAQAQEAIGDASRKLAGDLAAPTAATAGLSARMTELAGTSDANRLAVLSLAQGYSTNQITAVELASSIAALETAQRAQAGASEETKAATAGLTEEQRAQITSQITAEEQTRKLANAQAVIASIGGQVRAGLITAAEGADIVASRFGFAADEAIRLVNNSAAAARVNNIPLGQRIYQSTGVPQDALRAQEASVASQERLRAIEEARRQQLLATGTAAQGVAVRQREYNEAVKEFGAGSAEAISAQTALIQAQQRQTAESERGAKSAASVASKKAKIADKEVAEAEKRAERIADIEQDAQRDALDALKDYEEERLKIQQEAAEKRVEAERDFGDRQFATRASFYRTISTLDGPAAQAAAAEFEQAQQRAAEIAATQGADVADRYLQKITQILQDRARRAAEIAEAVKEGNDAEAERLRGLDQLDRQVEDRELERTLEGDSINKDEAAALEDAQADAQEKLAGIAERAGERFVDLEGGKLEAVTLTNAALAEQARLLGLDPGAATAAALPSGAPLPELPALSEVPAGGAAPAGQAGAQGQQGGPLLVSDAQLFAQAVTLSASVQALAAIAEAQQGQIDQLIRVGRDTADAVGRLSVRGT